jgi:YebC/PmpR family DNA-binding regulatory protein
MSGHSKWSKIKYKKEKDDAKKGKIYTKLIKEITIAARMGGGDDNANPRLRAAILAAKAANMPNENVTRAIKRGTGELEGVSYEEINYEGYGPGGVAMLIEVQTDNKNRTTAEIKHVFSKHGASLGEPGCVAWMFKSVGLVTVNGEGISEDQIMEAALDAGADDVINNEDSFDVHTGIDNFEKISELLKQKGFKVEEAKLAKVPKNFLKLEGKHAEQMVRLMESLEDNDDVKEVWANFDIDKSILENLM